MKSITELTDRDCIHCSTQEEWDAILKLHNPKGFDYDTWSLEKENTVLYKDGKFSRIRYAKNNGYTIYPASDFLSPTVSVLHQIGDYSLIRNGSELIIIKGSQAMTLTGEVINWIKTI